MKPTLLFFLLIFVGFSATAQKKSKTIQVTYTKSSNGTVIENQDPILLLASETTSLVTTEKILQKKAGFPVEQTYTFYPKSTTYQVAQLKNGKTILVADSTALEKQKFELLPDTKKILGYRCKKAKIIINSNTIEIWYTNALPEKGGPSVLGQNLGLVLEVNRNGNYQVLATKIELLKTPPAALTLPAATTPTVDVLTYRDILWKSKFQTIPVFENEIINFSDQSKSNDSILRFANGTILVKKVKLPKIKKGSLVFAAVTERSNGDAYDRTGSVFVIPMEGSLSFLDGLQKGISSLPVYDNGNGKKYQGITRTENYTPLLELMRFFTPFGIHQYNSLKLKNKVWQDSVLYRQEISELIPALSGQEVYIGMTIGNYDKGGHKVSLDLTIHPDEESAIRADTFVLPLFNTTNVMEMAGQEYGTLFNTPKGLEITFQLQQPLKNARLRYITTGHGGWENGDEFIPKKNTIVLDGKTVFDLAPWRTDCGSYRLSNPASGNFENGLSSSDYSRSNWCPGTVTNPYWIDLGPMAAGSHTITVTIPQGANEGGSFSSWNVSGVLIGE